MATLRLINDDAWKQGTTFALLLTLFADDAGTLPMDLTGKEAEMQWRKTASTDPVLTFASPGAPLAGTADGTITIDVADSTMLLSATATTMLVDPGTYLFDLILVDGNTRTVLFDGEIEITPLVTQET